MVAGAAALMIQAHPARSALQIKAMLMNSAQTQVFTSQAFYPGQLAPISRIGAGELRVNRAVTLSGAAWDKAALSAALSFGAVEAAQQTVVQRALTVENYSSTAKQYSITPSFRYAADQATRAVTVQAPASVTVRANSSATVNVSLLINPTQLASWAMNGGSQGGDGQGLNGPEYDGYLILQAGNETLSVPWHVLPRKAASTIVSLGARTGTLPEVVGLTARAGGYPAPRGVRTITLVNSGAEVGDYDVYALTGSSPQLPANAFPMPGDNFATVDLKSVGVRYLTQAQCSAVGGCMQWAISTYGRRAHPLYPAGFDIEVDVTDDGLPDFVVFQSENGGFGATGQSVVAIRPFNATSGPVDFFNIADLNSGIVQFTVPLSRFGAGVTTATTFRFAVFAWDNYFTGWYTDSIENMAFTPASPRYALSGGAPVFGSVPRSTSSRVGFTVNTAVNAAQSSESGFLMMFSRNAGNESQEIRP
jgi:hypothetical protein